MENVGRAAGFGVAFATILICPMSLTANTIISVTAPPILSFSGPISISWSQTNAYTDVTISALVDSFIGGLTPTADAYLTTHIGPGTTVSDEIAHARFTVPLQLPVCSQSSCGAFVTWFSGLSMGPGTYFLTMGPSLTMMDPFGPVGVGWFPALLPTVLKDTGVSEGAAYSSFSVSASYPPASSFVLFPDLMNFIVTGTEATAIPEPAPTTLIGFGALLVILSAGPKARRGKARG